MNDYKSWMYDMNLMQARTCEQPKAKPNATKPYKLNLNKVFITVLK